MGVTLDWLDGSLGPLIGDLSYHGCCFVSTVLRDILFVVVLCRMLFSLGCMESEQHEESELAGTECSYGNSNVTRRTAGS